MPPRGGPLIRSYSSRWSLSRSAGVSDCYLTRVRLSSVFRCDAPQCSESDPLSPLVGPDEPARSRPCMHPVTERGGAVNPDVADAGRQAMRIGVRRVILDRGWIEDDDVGRVTLAQQAAVAKPKAVCD